MDSSESQIPVIRQRSITVKPRTSITGVIATQIAPRILIGEDPTKIEKIVGRMDILVRDNHHAKSMVDAALHDIKGKALGVSRLSTARRPRPWITWISDMCRWPVPLKNLSMMREKALSTGFKLIKLKSLPDVESSVRCVLEMRKALGDDVRLMMDVNGMWNYDQALRALRKA